MSFTDYMNEILYGPQKIKVIREPTYREFLGVGAGESYGDTLCYGGGKVRCLYCGSIRDSRQTFCTMCYRGREEREMRFDVTKIKTIATAHEVEVGDYGWFGDSHSKMKEVVGSKLTIAKITDIDRKANFPFIRADFPFIRADCIEYTYFYPAPYYLAQEAWLKDNDLVVGDKVKVTREWAYNEKGFDTWAGGRLEYKLYTVKMISRCGILTEEGVVLPYFVIKRIKDEYRPFKNADEFKPYRGYWFRNNTWTVELKTNEIHEKGIMLGKNFVTFKELLDRYVFADTREPAGVKL